MSAVLLALVLAACGTTSTTPQRTGMVEVFIRDGATPAQLRALEERVQAVPGVSAYKYVSKEEALRRFRERFGDRIVANLPMNPMPASYELTVNDASSSYSVARRFFDDPAVDNDPGTHNGVKWTRE